jgi:hypothetical protein
MAKPPKPLFVGVFTDEDETLAAVKECREAGLAFHDVYTPFAIHGLDRAMGLPFSKVTWVTFLCGAMGTTIALSGMWYVTAWDWPLNVGGKPSFPFPAFVPIMFELTVLIGGLCTLVGMIAFCLLYPGKKAKLLHKAQTDDHFVVALKADDGFDEQKARAIFEKHHAVEVATRDTGFDANAEAAPAGGAA